MGTSVLEERVFLLNAEPRLLFAVLGERCNGPDSRVGLVRSHVSVQHLAQSEHGIATADRVRNDFDWSEHTIRFTSGSLFR